MDKEGRLRPKKAVKRILESEDSDNSDSEDSKKVYICPYKGCGKQFSESGNLKTHIRIHVILCKHKNRLVKDLLYATILAAAKVL